MTTLKETEVSLSYLQLPVPLINIAFSSTWRGTFWTELIDISNSLKSQKVYFPNILHRKENFFKMDFNTKEKET